MSNQIVAIVVNDETISLDGRTFVGMDELANALKSALEDDPNFVLVIGSEPTENYKGIGTIIYASQHAGVPVENLRWTMNDGDVVTFDELKARNSKSSM
jgi:hypothetical protein